MKKFQYTAIALLAFVFSTSVFSAEREVIVVNTSENGYMTVTYSFCGPGSCSYPPKTIDIYSKKNSSSKNPHYVSIEIPEPGVFDGVTVETVVEKEVLDGKPTDKVIAETRSRQLVCEGHLTDKPEPTTIINLTDLNGSPFVTCSTAVS